MARRALLQEWNGEGIESRVEQLQRLTKLGIRDPEISRGLALAITRGCPWRNDRCELEAIWWFMHRNIRYTGDISGYDTFQTARKTLEYGGGDCDDGYTLIANIALGNGFPVKGRITKNYRGGAWAHIYALVGAPKNHPTQWIPLDWTLGWNRFASHPPQGGFLEFDGHQIKKDREISFGDYRGW